MPFFGYLPAAEVRCLSALQPDNVFGPPPWGEAAEPLGGKAER